HQPHKPIGNGVLQVVFPGRHQSEVRAWKLLAEPQLLCWSQDLVVITKQAEYRDTVCSNGGHRRGCVHSGLDPAEHPHAVLHLLRYVLRRSPRLAWIHGRLWVGHFSHVVVTGGRWWHAQVLRSTRHHGTLEDNALHALWQLRSHVQGVGPTH